MMSPRDLRSSTTRSKSSPSVTTAGAACKWRRFSKRTALLASTISRAASMRGPGPLILRFLFTSTLLLPLSAAAENLFQVYRDAQRYDATYSAARQTLEAGRERLPQGRAGILPRLDLTGDATRSRFDIESNDPAVSASFVRSTSAAQYTLELTQPLYRPQN